MLFNMISTVIYVFAVYKINFKYNSLYLKILGIGVLA